MKRGKLNWYIKLNNDHLLDCWKAKRDISLQRTYWQYNSSLYRVIIPIVMSLIELSKEKLRPFCYKCLNYTFNIAWISLWTCLRDLQPWRFFFHTVASWYYIPSQGKSDFVEKLEVISATWRVAFFIEQRLLTFKKILPCSSARYLEMINILNNFIQCHLIC